MGLHITVSFFHVTETQEKKQLHKIYDGSKHSKYSFSKKNGFSSKTQSP